MSNIHTICVCGAGTMGSGIAQVAAQAGFTTIQFDVNESMLLKSKAAIEKSVQFLVDKQKITTAQQTAILNKIIYTSNINDCIANVCIEAIIEKKEAKIDLFNQLTAINANNAILATNTSSISINEIAEGLNNSTNLVGMHFFNPATIMKLVEVVKGNATDESVVETIVALCKQMNKVPVVCTDAPGFIVNRVARHYYLEAMKLVEQNLATIENVDAIMEATGFKMGPFKLMDLIGMDINFGVSNIVWEALGKPARLTPSILQQQKVEEGNLGRKTGKGFYAY
ncbi:MAG: 3-hydroxyacyl-CoA dehydrogenase NAD-binding domain-containing protein [Chitinophagaceae bacterium]|nr:3-hydroxyacyl-CoA dehydrogenase NAD-binding domain-containing protein [Chitinophagaceae bacterium]